MKSVSIENDTMSNGGRNQDELRRRTFVSVHRESMDYIANDATAAKQWTVPEKGPEDDNTDERSALVRVASNVRSTMRKRSVGDWIETLIPAVSWMKAYDVRNTLLADVVAGLTVGVMVVPQGMSYAKLAGLPVEYGLYTALFPIYAYALFGTSRQLAVGPVAIISLLLNTGLENVMNGMNIAKEDENYQSIYNQLAIQTSLLVALVYIAMGIFRMGFITIFLSHAVISGFTSGAAVIIGMSQFKFLVGYSIPNTKTIVELMEGVFSNVGDFNYKTFLLGSGCIFALVSVKYVGKDIAWFKWVRAAAALMVTSISILLAYVCDFKSIGIPIVGDIPSGFPSLTISEWFPVMGGSHMVVVVATISIVGFMESVAIAKQLASKHKYEIDASQELFGLGLANLVGAMFMSYPVTGSFSRSAINNATGAKSGVSGIVTATLVGFVLLFLTAVFEYVPTAVLGAIVIAGVLNLFDYEEAIYLYRVHQFDFAVWMTAFLGCLFLGVETGLAIAVIISLLIVLYESAYPHSTVLGRLPGTTYYRSIKQYSEAETI